VRILLVTPVVPCPANTGGRQRTNLIHRALCELAEVDTFVIAGEPDISDEHREILSSDFNVVSFCPPQQTSEIGWPRHLRWIHPPTVNRVVNVLMPDRQFTLPQPKVKAAVDAIFSRRSYDVVVARYLSAAVATGLLGRDRLAVDVDDLPTATISSRLAAGGDPPVRQWYLRRVRSRLAEIERHQLNRCGHVWVAKEADAASVGNPSCSVLRNIPFTEPGQPEAWDMELPGHSQSHILLTVGMLNYAPNVAGIDGFLKHAWPSIFKTVPSAEYRIVGSRLAAETKTRWERYPGVTVVGFAADLQAEYRQAAASVCPIPWGGGTNIKVAESLAYGRPAIVSAPAHRGWERIFPESKCVFVAREPVDFVHHCVELLRNPKRRQQMGTEGRLAARQWVSYDAFRKAVAAGVHAALESPRP